MKKILIFPASQRKQSLNQQLASYLAELLMIEVNVDFIDAQAVDLPLFNQDIEQELPIQQLVGLLYQRFSIADGIIVVTPEYNGSFSPYFKNTIDWISRLPRLCRDQGYCNPFYGKPVLLASATPGGSGGILGMQSTRLVFSYLGSLVLAEQISLPFASSAWDENGEPSDEKVTVQINQVLERFVALVHAIPARV